MGNLFILDVSKHIVLDFFRTILIAIDSTVYTFISVLFRAVFNIANFELIGFYEVFESRVYVILGIFMLFKVTISLITYLVNPDKISDKEQGAGKLITRIMIVLVMLIGLPTFFNLMTELQNKLIPVIPRVIIGTANTLDNEQVGGIAENMSLTLLQGFVHRKEECTNVSEINRPWDLIKDINKTCNDNNDYYAYDYLILVPTLVGILACYVVFSLCISVAIRAFKLIILRMMAPIPVISYIDPKSSKDGAFSHWSKTFISTWAELFIHLGMIYFIVYIIDFLLSLDAYQEFFGGLTSTGLWAFVDGILLLTFLIIGLLFFAKSAPQFVFDALGIKNKGAFTRMLSMGATAIKTGGNIASQYATRKEKNPGGNKLANFGASLFSGVAGAANAGQAILSSDKPNLNTGIDNLSKTQARDLNRIYSGSTLKGRTKARMQLLFGGETAADGMDRVIKDNQSAFDALKTFKSTAEDKALKAGTTGNKGILVSVAGHDNLNYQEFITHTEGAKNGNVDSLKYFTDRGFSNWQEAQSIVEELKDTQVSEFMHRVNADANYDGTVYDKLEYAKDALKGTGTSIDLSSGDVAIGSVKSAMGETSTRVRERKLSEEYKAAQADKNEVKK